MPSFRKTARAASRICSSVIVIGRAMCLLSIHSITRESQDEPRENPTVRDGDTERVSRGLWISHIGSAAWKRKRHLQELRVCGTYWNFRSFGRSVAMTERPLSYIPHQPNSETRFEIHAAHSIPPSRYVGNATLPVNSHIPHADNRFPLCSTAAKYLRRSAKSPLVMIM